MWWRSCCLEPLRSMRGDTRGWFHRTVSSISRGLYGYIRSKITGLSRTKSHAAIKSNTWAKYRNSKSQCSHNHQQSYSGFWRAKASTSFSQRFSSTSWVTHLPMLLQRSTAETEIRPFISRELFLKFNFEMFLMVKSSRRNTCKHHCATRLMEWIRWRDVAALRMQIHWHWKNNFLSETRPMSRLRSYVTKLLTAVGAVWFVVLLLDLTFSFHFFLNETIHMNVHLRVTRES